MRDLAAAYTEGKNASHYIFEGVVEKQELVGGAIGGPQTALSMTTAGAHRVVSVKVLRNYYGLLNGTVSVITGLGLGDCGFDFRTGEQYLVYAEKVGPSEYFTSICTGTNDLRYSGAALRLYRGEKAEPDDLLDQQSYNRKYLPLSTGTICGKASKLDGSPLIHASVDVTEIREEPSLRGQLPTPICQSQTARFAFPESWRGHTF